MNKCLQCNKELNNKKKKYCSIKCSIESKIKNIELICDGCGKKYVKKPWEIKKNKLHNYCSIKCKTIGTLELCECGKQFWVYPSRKKYYKKLYCSNECRIKYGFVGRIFKLNKKYDLFMHKVRHCAKYYTWKNECLKRDNYKCIECGDTNNLCVHHKYISMYDLFKKYGFNIEAIRNDFEFSNTNNGETVCKKHHILKHTKGKRKWLR